MKLAALVGAALAFASLPVSASVPPIERDLVLREWAGSASFPGLAGPEDDALLHPTPHPVLLAATIEGPSGLVMLPYSEAVPRGRLAASIHRFTASAAYGVAGFGKAWGGVLPSVELALAMDADRCEEAGCGDAGAWRPFYRGWRLSAKAQLLSQTPHGVAVSVSWFRVRPSVFFDNFSHSVFGGDRGAFRQIGAESRLMLSAARSWSAAGGGGVQAGWAIGAPGRVSFSAWQCAGRRVAAVAEYDRMQVDDETSRDPWSARGGIRVMMGAQYRIDLLVVAWQRLPRIANLADVLDHHVWVGVAYGGT